MAEGLRPALVASVSSRVPLTVVVTASGPAADEFADALSSYTDGVAVLPSWETLPHERLSPRLDTMAQRVAVLRRLTHPVTGDKAAGPIRILVTSARAWLQPVVADAAEVEPIRLKVGDSLDFEGLVERFISLGYARVDMVEKRGDIAVRGGLIDVFAPTEDHPVRVEFFGDEIDEIRYFSLSDQRTLEEAHDGLWAPACRELLLTDDVKQRAHALRNDLPGAAETLERLSEGIYAEGMEALAPVLTDSLTPLVQMLPADSITFMSEPEKIARRAADLEATTQEFMEAAWESAAAGGKIPVQVEQASFASLGQSRKIVREIGAGWVSLSSFGGQVTSGAEDEGELTRQPAGEAESPAAASLPALEDLPQDGSSPQVASALDLDLFLAETEQEFLIPSRDVEPYRGQMTTAIADLRKLLAADWRLLVTTQGAGSATRLVQVLGEGGVPARHLDAVPAALNDPVVYIVSGTAGTGFVMEADRLGVMTEQDFTGRRAQARAGKKLKRRAAGAVIDPLTLQPGDYIVHEQHGVGRFVELVTRTIGRGPSAVTRDFLLVEYKSSKRGHPNDRLFVPTESLDQVSKYVGGDAPTLNKMGGVDWAKTKQKARKAVREIAGELVRLYAARTSTKGYAFSPDTVWQRELEDAFPYPETPDQLTTIAEIKADMEKPYPMDRLLCGDVGYGKTEVAVRAAFKAVQDGKQVAILCPTTLLVQQHLETFTQRYMAFPVNVQALSRFTPHREADKIKTGLQDGSVDIVIGTHSLVTGHVRFKDLGLVIVDEEQRFGVEHKETLKQLRASVDVLSMSATPIPRTLEMAVTGIRQMSMLQTPPEERHPVLTYVGRYQDKQMIAAIRRELLRDGQVFYVHNRVESIDAVAAHVQQLVPDARVAVAHGKMSEQQLEQVIVDFWNREFDVLVCTTIVETGLDISNANTLIVDRADAMGLSQLHQLRGRVGRGRERAYAYFFYPKDKVLTETAHERLKTIASHTDLGAGMAVAMKDLEIRGAGNLLGGQQSGHIAGVGFDLYIRMVAEAVSEFKGEEQAPRTDLNIQIAVDAHIPTTYIPGERLRLETYAKIAAAANQAERDAVREELIDRYGTIPQPVELLLRVAKLRELMRETGLVDIVEQGRFIRFGPVALGDAQSARLRRLHPGAMQKPAIRQVLIPAPMTAKLGGKPVTDEALIEWAEDVITHILAWQG
nr:transcription-repair coupling factor [Boudabousia marimammalium]